jgi:hypothetical protein
MGYVIAAIVVLLLVAGFVTFFVINATKRSGRAGPGDPGQEGSAAGIAAPDESPLGDTTEHADGDSAPSPPEGADVPREGEDKSDQPRVGDPGPEATASESERLANRPR